MPKRSPYYDAKTFLLYLDSFQDQIPEGRFYHCISGTGGRFRGIMPLLHQLEQVMDQENTPQSFSSSRSFFPQPFWWEESSDEPTLRSGRAGNFVLRILFRQNASWQGTLTWQEEGRTEHFRSVLELLHLLHSVMLHNELTDRSRQLPLSLAE